MTRVFKLKSFARFARKARISEEALRLMATDVMAGHIDADLGHGIVKQRLGREGQGRSGGFRILILFRLRSHLFFVHGFAKKDMASLPEAELKALRLFSERTLALPDEAIGRLIADGEIIEILKEA